MTAVVHVDVDQTRVVEPDEERVTQMLEDIAERHPAVRGFHSLMTSRQDDGAHAEFHLTFDPSTSLRDSHQLVHTLSREITERTGISEVNIHVEPHQE